MKNIIPLKIIMLAILLFMAAGCMDSKVENNKDGIEQESDTGFIPVGPGSYDSMDTAVITNIDNYEKKITFLNLILGKRYTLTYDGTTTFSNKYGEAMSLAQMEEGNIVDVTFLRTKKKLNSMQLSSECFTNTEVSRFELDLVREDLSIGSDIYNISEDAVIFSEGKEIELMDLNVWDVLTVSGIENDIYSIVVNKGHGYLKLENDEKFIGGFIEVGQSRIAEITKDMILEVPEGSYQVLISHKGGGGIKQVTINRGEEVTLDIGDLTIPEPQKGQVVFNINPSNARLYVDGEEVDASKEMQLEYGIHRFIVHAQGYSSVTSYFKVNQKMMVVDVNMESLNKSEEEENKESTENQENIQKEDVSGNGIKQFQVHIDGPKGVEVYVDGNYIGIAPVAFKKMAGSHVITLRQSGFETRSYTIQLDNEEKDVNYVFAELDQSES